MKTDVTKLITLSILLIILSSCSLQNRMDQPTIQANQPIKIGWIGPLTGPSAVLGMDSALAAKIAVEDINQAGVGPKIELIVEDDQYNTAKSVTAYNRLVNVEGVRIILINTYSGVFALADQAKVDGVLIMDPLDCNSKIVALGDHVLCLATDSESIGHVLLDQIESNHAKKIGLLHFNSDAFMPLVKDVVQEGSHIPILVESYPGGTSDFKTVLLKMLQEGADSLVFLGYDETGIAMKQARDLGYVGKFYTTGTVTSPSLQDASKGSSEGAIFAFWDAPKDREPSATFASKFMKMQGRPPILDLASYPTYDAVQAIHKATVSSQNGGLQELIHAIIEDQGFDGVTGFVKFVKDGSMRIPESPHVLQNRNPVKI